MNNFEFNPASQEVESEFGERMQEKKKGMLTAFLEKNPKAGKRARQLAFVMMGITSTFAAQEVAAQEQDSEMDNTHKELLEDFELDDGKTLELPKGVIEKFSSSSSLKNVGNSFECEDEMSGELGDSDENIFVTTKIEKSSTSDSESSYDDFKVSTIIGETSGSVEARGDTLEFNAIGKTREAAIKAALGEASLFIGLEIKSRTRTEDSASVDNSLIDTSATTSSTYIKSYKVISEEYNEEHDDYSVTLEVLPGEVVDNK